MSSDPSPPASYDRREFLRQVSCGSLGIIGSSCLAAIPGCTAQERRARRPNIVLILADDMEVDRTETHDLASERPEEAERLNGFWQAWAERAHVLPRPGGGGS